MIPALRVGLAAYEGRSDNVPGVLRSIIEEAVSRLNLLKSDDHVEVTCFNYNHDQAPNTVREVVEDCRSVSPQPNSVMWRIPFGQNLEVDLPLDFDLDVHHFPLEIKLENDVPKLTIGWSFNLAFGYDAKEGFFLYTVCSDSCFLPVSFFMILFSLVVLICFCTHLFVKNDKPSVSRRK